MTVDYQAVVGLAAERLQALVPEIWASQESMYQLLTGTIGFSSVPSRSETFTRYGYMICNAAVEKAIRSLGDPFSEVLNTPSARLRILDHLVWNSTPLAGDINVMSQFLLNIRNRPALMVDQSNAYSTRVANLQSKLNTARIDPNTKLDKTALAPETLEVLNEFRSLTSDRVDASATLSYRVSPIGKTPAFADTQNLSSMRYHVQRYLKLKTSLLEDFYTIRHYSLDPEVREPQGFAQGNDDGSYTFSRVSSPYRSSTDGQYLVRSMYIRSVVYNIYEACIKNPKKEVLDGMNGILGVYPRLNSITVVVDKRCVDHLDTVVPDLFVKADPRGAN